MDTRWSIPKHYKTIYSRGLRGKHIDDTNQKYVVQLREILSTLNEQTYEEYFHHLLWFEEAAARECLQKQSVERVTIRDTNTANRFTIMVPGMEQKQRYVRIDDNLMLIPLSDPKMRLRANIKDIQHNRLTISFIKPVYSRINVNEKYKLVFLFSNYEYTRMHNAVDGIRSLNRNTKIFPKKNIECNKKMPIKTWFNPMIARNVKQRTAVEHIVSKTSVPAPYILHGPPGTGKTATIVEAILQVLIMDPSSKIIVCAPSNSAADDVACKLIKYESQFPIEVFLLRLNSSRRDWSTLPKTLIESSNRPVTNYTKTSNEMREKERHTRKKRCCSIFISTISYAPNAVKELEPRSFTHLFIDEAGQATEPLCLVPVMTLLAADGLLVLSGDPLQLGPVLTSQHAKEYSLGISLMERLMKDQLYKRNDPNYTIMLKKNFRSHANILQIPNEQFYNGQLEACAKEDAISTRDILNKHNSCRAIVFYPVFGQEAQEEHSSSYFNNEELQMLKYCIKQLTAGQHTEKADDIGIITPYTAQVEKIKKWLDNKGLEKIEVGSVESYQGREKKIILMSTVRGQGADKDKKVKLGFLTDTKRFNVALTRAKSKLIVIGNPNSLRRDEMWRIYIDTCKELGSYRKVPKDSLEGDELQKLTSGLRKLAINRRRYSKPSTDYDDAFGFDSAADFAYCYYNALA